MRKFTTIPVFLSATLVLLAAACGDGEPTPTATPEPSPAPTSTATLQPGPLPTSTPATPPEAEANFRFLVSDEVNAIDQFQKLEVTIDRIGLKRAGESGKWIEVQPQTPTVDLTDLLGENAQEVWSGTIPTGQYTKVFVYIDKEDGVNGELKEPPGQTVDVKLPSNKLQISKGFEVATDTPMAYVYDLTVIAAGNPQKGVKYILKPQIGQSGANQSYHEVKPAKADKGPKTKGDLVYQLEGDVVPGGTATLTLTHLGSPLANVPIEFNGEEIGITDASGQLVIQIPADADEAELDATLEGTLKIKFGEETPPAPEVSGTLTLHLDGDITPSGAVTLTVSRQGAPQPYVPIELNDEEIGVTNASGQLAFQIPADIQELELEAKLEGEFKLKFREEKIEPQKFTATITAITEGAELNSPWTVTIPGIEDPVTVFVVDLEGTPEIGSTVEIEGALIEGVILDAEAEVEEPDDDNTGSGKPDTPGKPDSPGNPQS